MDASFWRLLEVDRVVSTFWTTMKKKSMKTVVSRRVPSDTSRTCLQDIGVAHGQFGRVGQRLERHQYQVVKLDVPGENLHEHADSDVVTVLEILLNGELLASSKQDGMIMVWRLLEMLEVCAADSSACAEFRQTSAARRH